MTGGMSVCSGAVTEDTVTRQNWRHPKLTQESVCICAITTHALLAASHSSLHIAVA